jgi:hypothetical protein
MAELLRRHTVTTCCLVLGWLCWANLSVGSLSASIDEVVVRSSVHVTLAKIRDAGEVGRAPSDPFRLQAPAPDPLVEAEPAEPAEPAGPELSPGEPVPPPRTDGRDWGGAVVYLADSLQVWGEQLELGGRSTPEDRVETVRRGRAPAGSGPPPTGFRLVLQATLGRPEGGQARISGHTVSVGGPMPWLDSGCPPVLESVRGVTAVVRYADERYVLDLVAQPVIEVPGIPETDPGGVHP